MNNIIIGVIAWWIAEGCGLVQLLKSWLKAKKIWYYTDQFNYTREKRLKPLDCPLCLGFWLGITYSYHQTQDLSYSIVMGIISSVVAILTERIMNRL